MTFLANLSKQTRLSEALRPLWEELTTNRRAGLGLMVIVVLVAGFGLVSLHGATARAKAAYQSKAALLQRVTATAGERDWPQRRAASEALRASLQQRLWTATSEGLAQADLQAWISGIGRDVGLPMFDIRTEATKPANLPADVRQVTATITAQPSEAAVISLLERLDQAPHLAVVTRLHLRQQPSPMLELVLTAYARVAEAPQGAEK